MNNLRNEWEEFIVAVVVVFLNLVFLNWNLIWLSLETKLQVVFILHPSSIDA